MDRIFVIDDEILITETLKRLLSGAGYEVSVFHEAEPALAALRKQPPFLVLLDLQLPGMHGLDALRIIRRDASQVEVVMISGYATIDMAVEAMKLGAGDFLSKPLHLPEVLSRVGRIHENFRLRDQVDQLRERRRQEFFDSLHPSANPAMAALLRTIKQIAQYPDIVALITGESGTGKETIAKQVHYRSAYSGGPFVAINSAAIPGGLIESELFGYEPGAFTGALAQGKAGLIEKAEGGTLFLDEIGELDPTIQVKLLRFLQDREVFRIGGGEGRRIACNIVAATNRDPERLMAEGRFREDLYYRINVIRLHLPPLREWPDDIVSFAEAFLKDFNTSMGRQFVGFDEHARRKLREYDWPGNIRELHNAVERACLLATGRKITSADLHLRLVETSPGGDKRFSELMPLETMDYLYTRKVLDAVAGNKSEAARILGISRNRLKRVLSQA